MSEWKARRFWTDADLRPADGGFEIMLDSRVLRTPGKHALVLPTEALARAVTIPVIASGGVSSLADLKALDDTKVIAGAISGRALYDGALDLRQALAALA